MLFLNFLFIFFFKEITQTGEIAIAQSFSQSLTTMFVGKRDLLAVLMFNVHESKRALTECAF